MVRRLATSHGAVKRGTRRGPRRGRPDRGHDIEPLRDHDTVTASALKWIRGSAPRWLEVLADLVGTESHPSQRDGVQRVGATVTSFLDAAGFVTERVPRPPLDPDVRWLAEVLCPEVAYEDMADPFVARRPGSGPPVLLLGDLDTAFPPGSVSRFPFDVTGGRATGPGVADMKGGLVALVAAVSALDALEAPTPEISVVLSGDEQAGSLGSRELVAAEAARCRWCLCVECARDGGR
jgi:glutamate carboxypeptidase